MHVRILLALFGDADSGESIKQGFFSENPINKILCIYYSLSSNEGAPTVGGNHPIHPHPNQCWSSVCSLGAVVRWSATLRR